MLLAAHLRRAVAVAPGAFVLLCAACAGELAGGSAPGGSSSAGGAGSDDGGGGTAASAGDGGSGNAGSGSGGSGGGASGVGGQSSCGTAEVRAVFAASCTGSLCHDASSPAAELDLTVFDPAAAMSGVPGALCTDVPLVDPGSPSTSLLFTKVSEATPACGERMPIGVALDAGSIDCIASWITRLATDPPPCETCGGPTCTDLLLHVANCGECGSACGGEQICANGACEGCPEGQTSCAGTCVDVMTSSDHCGSCGVGCGAGQVCADGV